MIKDSRNFNKGTQDGNELLLKSIGKLGAGRSILVDKNNVIIAGNKTYDAYTRNGNTDIKVVETIGNKLVVVKRNDIDINTKKGRELALADNQINRKNLDWNEETMYEILGEEFLNDWEYIDNYTRPDIEPTEYEDIDAFELDMETLPKQEQLIKDIKELADKHKIKITLNIDHHGRRI